MGPHFFKCGKVDGGRQCAPSMLCFNGAALFQVRKAGGIKAKRNGQRFASMGPHFFKCGKLTEDGKRELESQGFNGAALFQVRKAAPSYSDRYE